MKVASARFKEAVNKAIKGAGFNNLIPLTQLIGIKLSNGKLRFLTTDAAHNVCVIVDKVTGDDLDVTLDADKFGKLISKVTSDEIELTVQDSVLVIKANGTYKMPLTIDEEGLVSFPDISSSAANVTIGLKLSSVLNAYNINKAALSQTLDRPYLTGYYCKDRVITTNGDVITFNNFKMFDGIDDAILLPAQLVQLLTLNDKEDIVCNMSGDNLLFITDDVIIESHKQEGVEQYPADDILQYLDEAFESSCKLPKELLLSVLDRLSLFIEQYDKNGAYFTFGRTGLTIHSKKDASTEIINYIESNDFKPFSCLVDIPMLKEQLLSYPEDTVKLYYGNENAIKLECGKVVQVISLLEEEA